MNRLNWLEITADDDRAPQKLAHRIVLDNTGHNLAHDSAVVSLARSAARDRVVVVANGNLENKKNKKTKTKTKNVN